MGLVPVNMPRIIEDLQTAIFALRTLNAVETEYTDDRLQLFRSQMVGERISRDEYDALPPDAKAMWYTSVDDIHAEIFEQQWKDFRIAIRRLSVLLNDGDTELLDCDYMTRMHLESLWRWVEACHIEKPEFVPGGPQVWAGRAGFQAFSGERYLEMLGGNPADPPPQEAAVGARFKSPPCPQCGGKTKVNRTDGDTRYLYCLNEECAHSFKRR